MTFPGKFETPVLGPSLTKPIPIVGQGTVQLDVGGIRVRGFRSQGVSPAALIGAAVGLLIAYLFFTTSIILLVSCGIGMFLALPRGTSGIPFEMAYRWDRVGQLKVKFGVVVLHVHDAGKLYFRPNDGAEALRETLSVVHAETVLDRRIAA